MLTPSFLNAVGAPAHSFWPPAETVSVPNSWHDAFASMLSVPGPINTPFHGKLGRVQQHRNTRRLALPRRVVVAEACT